MTSSELDASGNLVSKIGVENVASNKGSGIIITQAGAYVNHNESTAMDDAHLIVKKQDLTSHTSNKNNPHNVTKAQVGLGNVDNTADKDKPISDATQSALDLKATVADLNAHKNDKNNPHGVTKAQIGLENVDNTSDKNKPISDATQAALDEINGNIGAIAEVFDAQQQQLDSIDRTLGDTSNKINTHTDNKSNPHNVTATQIGLGNVNNTSDANKPVSTAQQAALDLKADKSDTYTKAEVDAKVSSVYRFKGSVANQAALPTEGQTAGDAYNVEDTGANYAWTGSEWDKLSETVDLSGYATKTDLNGKQNTLTPGEGISIVGNVISNTQTSAEWGKVTGTLSSQTDLQNALNAKANNTDTVHTTGDETIGGIKTFTSSVLVNGVNNYVELSNPNSKTPTLTAFVRRTTASNAAFDSMAFGLLDSTTETKEYKSAVQVCYDADNNKQWVTVPQPEDGDDSNAVATTAWVNTAIEAALGTISTELASIIGE